MRETWLLIRLIITCIVVKDELFLNVKAFLEAGPYKMTITRFEKCPDEGTREMVMDFQLRKVNRTLALIYGNIDLTYPLDRNIMLKVSVSIMGNGGWKPNTFTLDAGKNGCAKQSDLLGKFWKTFWLKANHTMTDPCNIPAGNYKMTGLDASDIHIDGAPVLIYGLYRPDVLFYSKEYKLLGCLRSVFEITRKNIF